MKIVIASANTYPGFITYLRERENEGHIFDYVEHARQFVLHQDAEAFIDFSFEGKFYNPTGKPLLIGETIHTLKDLNPPGDLSARFCEWQGFPERECWELATSPGNYGWVSGLMQALGKRFKIVADEPGLVAPRIIAAIINEAFYAWEEGVSNAAQVDLAMKLGTNYPEGPFEWGKKIGFRNIFAVLEQLGKSDKRYMPHPWLLNNSF